MLALDLGQDSDENWVLHIVFFLCVSSDLEKGNSGVIYAHDQGASMTSG